MSESLARSLWCHEARDACAQNPCWHFSQKYFGFPAPGTPLSLHLPLKGGGRFGGNVLTHGTTSSDPHEGQGGRIGSWKRRAGSLSVSVWPCSVISTVSSSSSSKLTG